MTIRYFHDLNENGRFTVFLLPRGRIELYETEARILFLQLKDLGCEMIFMAKSSIPG